MAERVSISQWAERCYYVIASQRLSQLGWRAYRLQQRHVFPLRPTPVPLLADEPMLPLENSGVAGGALSEPDLETVGTVVLLSRSGLTTGAER